MKYTRISVIVPDEASEEYFDRIADLAYELQPEERDWDVFVYGVSGIEEGDL